ncbi:hypothetical protein MHM582_2800 [Microbacterium sp. HM58-2]|nr:hypothetical protein MHM582_2800 [Microbacterium sp. HM58-2]
MLSGCSSTLGVTTHTCIDWIAFETPADAAEEADAVVVGRISGQAGTTTYMGMTATTWNVEADTWLEGKGEHELVVTSLPRSCDDPGDTMSRLQGTEPLVLFLRDASSGWEIVTPWQGVVPATPDGGIPPEWPADVYE